MEELHFDFECEPDEVRLPVPKQLLLAHPDLQLQVPKLEQLQVPKLEQLQITVETHDEQYPVQDSDQKLHPAQKEPNEHVFDGHDTVLAVKDQHGAVPLSEGQSIVVPVHTQPNLDAAQTAPSKCRYDICRPSHPGIAPPSPPLARPNRAW